MAWNEPSGERTNSHVEAAHGPGDVCCQDCAAMLHPGVGAGRFGFMTTGSTPAPLAVGPASSRNPIPSDVARMRSRNPTLPASIADLMNAGWSPQCFEQ